MKIIKNSFLSLFALIALVNCSHTKVKVPNTKVCSVAGVFSAGADCAYTLSPVTEEMNMDEFLDFLEPQLERPDPNNPSVILPERSGALCQSADDYNKQKTALEIACSKLGSHCDEEMKRTIRTIKKNLSKLVK